jgi:hypothetical protein
MLHEEITSTGACRWWGCIQRQISATQLSDCQEIAFGVKAVARAGGRTGLPVEAFLTFVALA